MTTGSVTSSPVRPEPVVVGRLACRFRIPDAVPRRPETIDRLVRAIETGVPDAVAHQVRPVLDGAAGVIRIRTLRLEAHIDLGRMDDAAVGERLGRLIALALARELRRSTGTNRREFRNRAAYLAAFVTALRQGRAWQSWWLQEFRSLRALGETGAAVHALAREPAHLLGALHELEGAGQLEAFLDSLNDRDLRRLWDALGIGSTLDSADPDAAAFASLARAARAAPPSLAVYAGRRRARALRLLAVAGPKAPGTVTRATLARAALHFAGFEAALAEVPELASLIATRAGLYPALRRSLANTGHAATLAWLEPMLATGDPLAQALVEPPVAARRMRSAVGGLALLLPALHASGIWLHLVGAVGEDLARRLVFVTLLKPLGRTRALLEAGDLLLAGLAGLPAPPVLDARAPAEPEPDPGNWPIAEVRGDAGAFDLGTRFGYPWLGPQLDRALSRLALGLIEATAAGSPPLDRLAPAAFVNLVLAQPATLETSADQLLVKVQATLYGVARGLFPAVPLSLPWLDRPLRLEPVSSSSGP